MKKWERGGRRQLEGQDPRPSFADSTSLAFIECIIGKLVIIFWHNLLISWRQKRVLILLCNSESQNRNLLSFIIILYGTWPPKRLDWFSWYFDGISIWSKDGFSFKHFLIEQPFRRKIAKKMPYFIFFLYHYQIWY